jgi:hypothetical protein
MPEADSASCCSTRNLWETPVQEFIARENIKRFEAQLAKCADDLQRVTLERLLATERQRLQTIRRQRANTSAAMDKGNS